MKKMSTYIEGYFASNKNDKSEYPYPSDSGNKIDQNFLDKLYDIEENIFLKKRELENIQFIQYMGYSRCRLCKQNNGNCEFKISYEGKTYLWPEGFYHYCKDHNVEPTKEFKNVIMNYK
jgi:hypothetical protein